MESKITDARIRWIFIIAFVTISAFLLFTFYNMNKAETSSGSVKSSLDFLLQLERTSIDLNAMETSQNAFAASDGKLLAPFYDNFNKLRRDTTLLADLDFKDEVSLNYQYQLLVLLNNKMLHSKEYVEIFKLYGADSATHYMNLGRGKMQFDNTIGLIDQIEKTKRFELEQSNQNLKNYASRISWEFFALVLLFLGILFYSFKTINREFKKWEENDHALRFNASVVQNMSDPVITIDRNYKITNWNKHAEELYGYTEEEVTGRHVGDVLKTKFSITIDELGHHVQTYGNWKGEVIHHHKNGTTIFAEITISEIKNEMGEVLGIVEVVRDSTERKKLQEELQRLNQNLEQQVKVKAAELTAVFERITDAFIALDNNWNYTYLNKMAAIMHNREEGDLEGKNIWTEYPELIDGEFYHYLQLAKETQQPQRVQLYYDKDAKWYEDLIYPTKDGISVYYHDITERREAEIALEKIHERLQYHINNTPMAFIEMDSHPRVIQGNENVEKVFGWTEDELLKNPQSFWELFYKDDLPFVKDSITQLVSQGSSKNIFTARSITKNGKIIFCEWYNSVLKDKAGTVIGIMSLVLDITERKKSLEQLELSEKALQKSNERFTLVARATNDAVWDWDFSTGKIWGNDSYCEIFDLKDTNEYSFEKFLEHLHPGDKDLMMNRFRDTLKQRNSLITEEYRLKTAKGQWLTFYNRAYILYNSDGKGYRMLGAMQDITELRKSARQLTFEKELSDSIINSLPGIFYLMDNKGSIFRWNNNLVKVTGYSAEEIKTMNVVDFFIDKEVAYHKIQSAFTEGESQQEAHLVLKNGNWIPYYFTGIAIMYEGEECLMGVGIDVSERVKSQKELKKSEEHFRTLIEQASDGIFICDKYLQYLDVNTSATLLTGYTKEELLQMNIFDQVISVDPESENALLMEDLFNGNVVIRERQIRRKNGSIIDVEISAKLLPDGKFQGIVRDITARKAAAESLRLSENKYRLLFNQNPMPMWMLSLPENSFVDVNPAALSFYGYSKEAFLQMHENDLEHSPAQHNSASLSGNADVGIREHRKKDGTLVKVNIIAHDIIYEEKPCKLVLANDVTDKLAAEENLLKSHEELRQLATHLENIRETERTHMAREIHDELGQQLTGLKMDISWLNKKIKSEDEEINQKIKDTISLIDKTVITVRRIATQLRPSILDDLGLIAAMEWQSEDFEKRSEIPTYFSANVLMLEVKPEIATVVFRVFQECLTNVLRHASASLVEANLIVSEGKLELTIKDNGKGFDPAEIENKKTLGLLGMKERVLLMGGTYQITSEPEKGTLVRIIVPLAVQQHVIAI
ncbi:MAG TPA: PAS domain S-box protein [Ferruginibacter sp.]|nr:PAS domain S-box protein [Ferruginibacter sp.]